MRAFTVGNAHTISEQCESCQRWVWCLRHQEEASADGTCYCGHRYRIVFDAEMDWNRPFEPRCLECGTEHRMSQRHEGLNPWRWINPRQVLCNHCSPEGRLLELTDFRRRTRMIAGDVVPGQALDQRFAAHNTEINRFHTELATWERAVGRGEILPAHDARRLREVAAGLEEQRRRAGSSANVKSPGRALKNRPPDGHALRA
jgi:hypothetical protein